MTNYYARIDIGDLEESLVLRAYCNDPIEAINQINRFVQLGSKLSSAAISTGELPKPLHYSAYKIKSMWSDSKEYPEVASLSIPDLLRYSEEVKPQETQEFAF